MRPNRAKNSLRNIGIWRRLIKDFGLLYALIKDYWNGKYREVSLWSVVIFILTIVYVLCPIDLLSDFVPGVGQIDDAAVVLFCMYFLEKDLYKYKEWKAKNTGVGDL